IVILHTNDTHSRMEPLPGTDKTAPGKGGAVRRASYMQQIRNENKDVLLLDAGDFLQGTPYFNMFKGEAEVKAMNLLGYDAATIGNHEFDYGLVVLEQVARQARFPIVSSNYDFSGTPLQDLVKPFIILKKAGVKIGVIGIDVQPEGLVSAENYQGMKYRPAIETANRIAEKLRKQDKCDMVICLSHLGYLDDIKLAEASRNIDLIIGGHSHTYMAQPDIRKNLDGKDVMIHQTNGRGVYVGRIDVSFVKDRKIK
ncbi:MAG TPA: metallophosphatase, partial [Porphyromonadaceae bacterium]|nr:metallophosphatase [Porphyromonadaceae bacterium]